MEGSAKTPKINFDPDGNLEMYGRSIPEHSIQFYEPLFNWLDEYKKSPADKTEVNFTLEYFNTSSSKCILDLFRKLQEIKDSGKEVVVNWHYEADDDDMRETGEDYQAITGMKFEMKEAEEIFGI